MLFFFSSRRRHTRCALVTGVQTCALPICGSAADHLDLPDRERAELVHLVAGALAQGFVDRHAVDQDRRGPPADVRRAVAACLALRREPGDGEFQRAHDVGAEVELLCEFLLAYDRGRRSEEHTSELQSLMRISYA